MQARLSRPVPVPAAGGGLLGGKQFQIAYCTQDVSRAQAWFAERFGITRWRSLDGALPQGGQVRIELAWAGTMMVELVTASGPGSEVYVERLPADRFAIRHHHLGFLIRDEAEWTALRAAVDRGNWTVRVDADIPGFMRQLFVEVPELDHLLEYLWPEPAGLAFLNDVPSN